MAPEEEWTSQQFAVVLTVTKDKRDHISRADLADAIGTTLEGTTVRIGTTEYVIDSVEFPIEFAR